MKITDKYVFFWNGIYSNWQPYYFFDPVAKRGFDNSEQAFMWWKADFFRDFKTRDIIGVKSDPRETKQLGRQISNYDDGAWSIVRLSFMEWVNYCKFTYTDPALPNSIGAELLSTGNKTIVEASPNDGIWGIKMSETDPLIEDETKWKGKNLLGIALMNVRKTINYNPFI
jgi:ribA/ribD-fused uncharacterized protein